MTGALVADREPGPVRCRDWVLCMTPFACITLIAILLVVWLLVAGLRGRRQDSGAVCRACGADLTAHDDDEDDCPNCRADLTIKGAIRIGRYRRYSTYVALAWPTLTVAVLLLNMTVFDALAGTHAVGFKPVWWLRLDMNHGSEPEAHDAVEELLLRVRARRLNGDQLETVADDVLVWMAATCRPWLDNLGDLIGLVHRRGRMTAAQHTRYLKLLMDPSLELPKQVNQGDRLELQFDSGIDGRRLFRIELGATGGLDDPTPIIPRFTIADTVDLEPGLQSRPKARNLGLFGLAVGSHAVKVAVHAQLLDPLTGQTLATCRMFVSDKFDLIPYRP